MSERVFLVWSDKMPRALLPSESQALARSEGLLRFAAENVKDLPPAVVSTICVALDAQQATTWDEKIATDFWCAFNSLCALIKPVTVDTLSTNLCDIPSPKWMFWVRRPQLTSLSRRTADRYLGLLIVLLLASAILTFVVSTVAGLNSEAQKLIVSCNQLTEKMDSEINSLEPAISTKAFSAVDAGRKEAVSTLQKQLSQYYYLTDQIRQSMETGSRLILPWSSWWSYIPRKQIMSFSSEQLRAELDRYYEVRSYAEVELRREAVITGVISSSVLPILLGIMGACAYVVRLISEQIMNTTFSQASPTRHLIRVALGGLAGVVIGFGGVLGAASLSSSALAFVAGYAVEPVFATFDSIAEKFRR